MNEFSHVYSGEQLSKPSSRNKEESMYVEVVMAMYKESKNMGNLMNYLKIQCWYSKLIITTIMC